MTPSGARMASTWRGARFGLALVLASANPCASLRAGLPRGRRSGPNHADSPPAPLDPWTYHPEAGYLSRLAIDDGYAQDITSSGPACRSRAASEEGSGALPEYSKWQFAPPGSRDWLQFDREVFCRRMAMVARDPARARLLFVGDSMSQHMLQALTMSLEAEEVTPMMLGQPRRSFMREEDFLPAMANGNKNFAATACGGRLYVQQQGSLDLVSDYTGRFVFRDHVNWLRSFDVVVLELPWSFKTRDVLWWAETLVPHQKLLLRTPTIGHEHTGAQYNHSLDPSDVHPMLRDRPHRAPLRTPEEVVSYYRTIEGHTAWMHKRAFFEKAIPDLEKRGFAVADFFYLAAMTWDRHRDPLHFCTPGPIERWNDVLHNWLVRGHLRDYREWAANFAREVKRLGGLTNSRSVQFAADDGTSLADPMLEAE